MRLSSAALELARIKYIQEAEQISTKHHRRIQGHQQFLPRGGAQKLAIDNEHLEMAREIARTYVHCHIELFVAEGLVPDNDDVNEMRIEITNIINRNKGNEFWRPRPATSEVLGRLPDTMYLELATQVRQMELERRMVRPSQPALGNIQIQGHNFAPIQQGGVSNLQIASVNTGDELTPNISKLLSLIEAAVELSQTQKLAATTDINHIHELSKLDTNKEVQAEAKSRLESVTSTLSLSADLVSLGMPLIQIIRTYFGI